MEIDEKYFKLLNLLIYDKRRKINGMICSLVIDKYINGYGISYRIFTNRVYAYTSLFLDDILKGNVVFLLPFSKGYLDEVFQKMAKDHEIKIKEFFGDDFREDMIMRISEEERQEEIRKWEAIGVALENWDCKCEN